MAIPVYLCYIKTLETAMRDSLIRYFNGFPPSELKDVLY